ncbi:MAG: EAL domain-containing protein [Parasphingorhabdus sp.]
MKSPKILAAEPGPISQLSLWESLGLVEHPEQVHIADRVAKDLGVLGRLWSFIVLVKLLAVSLLFFINQAGFDQITPALFGLFILSIGTDLCLVGFAALAKLKKIKPFRQLRFVSGLAFLSSLTFAGFLIGILNLDTSPVVAAHALVFHCVVAMIVTVISGKQRFVSLLFSFGLALTLFNSLMPAAFLGVVCLYIAASFIATSAHLKRDYLEHQTFHREKQKEERAQLLLNAFEDAALGWFWETDRNGTITYISDSIRQQAVDRFGDLVGMSLHDLIIPHDEENGVSNGERTLGFHLSSRSAFKEIAVRSAIFESERWWSLSGNPIINSFGQFQGFRGSGADLTEMRRSQEEVKQLAQFDSLTGLSNRLQMQGILEKAIVGPTGEIQPCALLLLDLDRFKTVNDTMGHPAGDALLKQVAKRLERTVGRDGHAGRLGGDEFKVVLPGAEDKKALAAMADAVISALSQPYTIEGKQVVIGASIGIAMAPVHGSTTNALVRNADLALYAAKDAGRGVHCFYNKSMHADAEDRRNIEQNLREALTNGELHLVYQPQVSTVTEHISGFEALLRWDHPKRGPISPAVFIPIAEEAGLISRIGEWALRTACFELAKWPEQVKIAVNVSSIQFANPDFPIIVTNALSSAGVSAERLELEITESVFLVEGGSTDKMFAALKGLGCRLSLDDFGTGYSSLGYLKNAPFDKIKIDQGFVKGASIPGNRNAAIIKSIVSLAEALDMETIAEGAETHDELELIRTLGCSHVQGYIYSKPLLAEEVRPLLTDGAGPMKADGHKSSRSSRRKMLRTVKVIHDDHKYDAQIRNISGTGALVIGLWNVPIGTDFIVEFTPTYRAFAKARWSHESHMGIEFEHAIDLDQLGTQSEQRSQTNLGTVAA